MIQELVAKVSNISPGFTVILQVDPIGTTGFPEKDTVPKNMIYL